MNPSRSNILIFSRQLRIPLSPSNPAANAMACAEDKVTNISSITRHQSSAYVEETGFPLLRPSIILIIFGRVRGTVENPTFSARSHKSCSLIIGHNLDLRPIWRSEIFAAGFFIFERPLKWRGRAWNPGPFAIHRSTSQAAPAWNPSPGCLNRDRANLEFFSRPATTLSALFRAYRWHRICHR